MTPNYDLKFLSLEAARTADHDGELICPAVDAHLCRGGVVPLVLEWTNAARALRKSEGTLTLESLQLRSIEAFIREQVAVREAVETVMTHARQSWLRLDESSVADMWSQTSFTTLYLPTRELNEIMDGPPETVSAYGVMFDVAWDEEHGTRALTFRDGVQVGFGLTGDEF